MARSAASAPGEQADALWSLAQARRATGALISETRAAAEQALQRYRDLGDSQRADEIRRWLRALR